MWWVLIPLLLTLVAYYFVVNHFAYWKRKKVVQKPISEVLGKACNAMWLKESLPEMIMNMYNEFPHKRYCGLYPFCKPTLLVRDPELIKQLTIKDFDHFTDHRSFFPEEAGGLFNNVLFNLKGQKWRHMRATLSPTFTSSKMKTMFVLMSECATTFVNYFESHTAEIKSVDMTDVLTRYANDVIATSAFGIKCDSLADRNNEFYMMGKETVGSFKGILNTLKLVMFMTFPDLTKMLGFTFFKTEVSKFFLNLIKQSIKTREENNIVRPDMVHILMEARKGKVKLDEDIENEGEDTGFATAEEHLKPTFSQSTLTDNDIASQALIFFLAGFDAVSRQMCFVTHELAVNPDIQDSLREEIDDTMTKCNGKLTYVALAKMKYLDMVVSEVLRKWPNAVMVDRVCVKPYTIKAEQTDENSVSLDVGDMLWIPVYGIHRDPNYYPDPERFDPERFNDENKSSINPYTYIPFGVGPRNCIGSRFALLEIKILVVNLLAKFKLIPVEKTPIPLKMSRTEFSMTSATGFHLGFEPRKNSVV